MADNKLPALQFYVGDWRKDVGVQSLDYRDRGIWFETLCLMHESEERGKLVLNGSPMPDPAIARVLGLGLEDWTEVRGRLLDYGVASEEDGVFLCRRMVRDQEVRRKKSEAGRKGGSKSPGSGKGSKSPSRTQAKAKQTPKQNESTETAESRRSPQVEDKQEPSKSQAKGEAKRGSSVSVSSSTSGKTPTPSPSPDPPNEAEPEAADPPDGEGVENRIKDVRAIARRAIIAIRGGTDRPVRIGSGRSPVGIGADLVTFRDVCRKYPEEPPELIAKAIYFIPVVTSIPPPVTLKLWTSEKHGPSNFQQCLAKARANEPIPDLPPVDVDGLESPETDPEEFEEKRSGAQAQLASMMAREARMA